MSNNTRATRATGSDLVTNADGKFLQRQLFNAANMALNDAMADRKVTPALLSSIHRICMDNGVVAGDAGQDALEALAAVLDEADEFDFNDVPNIY